MIAIAAFVAQEVVEQTEIFEHLALRFEREVGSRARERAAWRERERLRT